ncbi:MAG: GGDEF domain-containing protein [Chloroflexi bacterium]|nr:GGDEF domain-containing protein [Chloroflexota bacterium]
MSRRPPHSGQSSARHRNKWRAAPAGDALLQQVAGRLSGVLRHTDTVARLGGDEFAVLLQAASEADATTIAEALLCAMHESFDLGIVRIGASLGLTCHPENGADAETLLRCADIAMYVAKRSGHGIARYSVGHEMHLMHRVGPSSEMRDVLAPTG